MLCCAVFSCSVVSYSLGPHGLQLTRLLCPWGFSSQKQWSGLPCPPPGDLPNLGIEPRSPDHRWISYHLRQRGSHNVVHGCDLKNDRIILVRFRGKRFNITVIQLYAQTINPKKLKLNGSMNTYKTIQNQYPQKMFFSSQRIRMQKQEVKRHLE